MVFNFNTWIQDADFSSLARAQGITYAPLGSGYVETCEYNYNTIIVDPAAIIAPASGWIYSWLAGDKHYQLQLSKQSHRSTEFNNLSQPGPHGGTVSQTGNINMLTGGTIR